MSDTALYYALSTIAQCAAALAALIGFLGLWRLDRVRDEERQAEDEVIAGVLRICNRGADNIPVFGRVFLLQIAHKLIAEPTPIIENGWEIHHLPTSEQIIKSTLRPTLRRYDALPGERQRLMGTLSRFLRRTLVILALAISGLVVADVLYSWVLTRWLTGLLIIFAAYRLWRDTYAVVREAARSIHALVILALLLLTTPAWAGTTRCTTYERKSLRRWQTLCDDGTRATSYWNRTLERWDTTVTPPPGQRCTGRLNPKSHQWEGRCR
jgi:hypothetical protein